MIAHGERLSFARVFLFPLLILLSQGHPDSVVPFDFGSGPVDVISWAQMLAALKALLRPFLLPGKDLTKKLKRLWAYEVKRRSEEIRP
jgi:hypothetical protein